MQSIFWIVQTGKAERFIAFEGEDTDVVDEARVFHSEREARALLRNADWRRVRRIECIAGQETRLLPE